MSRSCEATHPKHGPCVLNEHAGNIHAYGTALADVVTRDRPESHGANEVEAKALREAADEIAAHAERHEWHRDHARPNSPGKSQWEYQAAQWRQAEQILRIRADRIERGE